MGCALGALALALTLAMVYGLWLQLRGYGLGARGNEIGASARAMAMA